MNPPSAGPGATPPVPATSGLRPRERTTARALAALAAGLCQDADLGLEVAPGGWSWDPVTRTIRVSAEGLAAEGAEYCAGIVAHEVGHALVTRYGPLLAALPGDPFPSAPSARSLLNAIEDPRVDRYVCRRYPGAEAWQARAKVAEVATTDAMPTFLRFCLECAAEGDRAWRPSATPGPGERRDPLPDAVVAALAETRGARRAYAEHQPPSDLDAPVPDAVLARWRAEVWPRGVVRWPPRRREQRIQLDAWDALQLAAAAVFPAARALWEGDRDRIARFLAGDPARAGRGRRLLEEGRPAEIVAEAMRADPGGLPGDPPPWALALATQLLDGAVSFAVPAPLATQGRRGGRGATPPRTAARPLAPWQPTSDYDRAYAEVAGQIDVLVGHLERILRPRRRLRARPGHPTGRAIALRRAMAFEADPRRYDELWTRATIPDRREGAFGLLVDLSGSMTGPKAHAALLGTVLVAETLHRLGVPFAIDGFQDVLVPLSDFREPFGPAVRRRIAEMVQEVAGCRDGGNNQPRWNDDGPCLLEHAEKLLAQPATDRVLIVVSDGLPEGCRSEPDDLRAAIARIRDHGALRLVALGLGPHTGHVRSHYPESVADVPVGAFARTIGGLVERLLVEDAPTGRDR